jgi:NhaP-type Na+/H+ or K+/H+ antiporter
MLAAALIFGLATVCQIVAPLLRVPALILLLPVGFLLGTVAPQLQPDKILGPAFPVVVDLIVAVILFQGGMELGKIRMQGVDVHVVRRLVWIGAPFTWAIATVLTHFFLGIEWYLAVLMGAMLIVSGPTVVTPILNFARPTQRVRGILMWEGTTLDPLGGILAVVIFQVIRVTTKNSTLDAIGAFIGTLLVAFIVAALGVLIIAYGSKLIHNNGLLGMQLLIGTVLFAAGFANFIAEGSGLLTALLMGVALNPLARKLNAPIDEAEPFFNTVTSMGIGVLFISISALVPSSDLATVTLPAVGIAIVLILFARPFIATLCTHRAGLKPGERAFIGWMDPRGIVAAATASSLGASLVAAKVPGSEALLPATFIIVAVTVFIYGLSAVPVAQALGIRTTTSSSD